MDVASESDGIIPKTHTLKSAQIRSTDVQTGIQMQSMSSI
jgi:hypothetical protein